MNTEATDRLRQMLPEGSIVPWAMRPSSIDVDPECGTQLLYFKRTIWHESGDRAEPSYIAATIEWVDGVPCIPGWTTGTIEVTEDGSAHIVFPCHGRVYHYTPQPEEAKFCIAAPAIAFDRVAEQFGAIA